MNDNNNNKFWSDACKSKKTSQNNIRTHWSTFFNDEMKKYRMIYMKYWKWNKLHKKDDDNVIYWNRNVFEHCSLSKKTFILFRSTKATRYITLTITAIEKCSTHFTITIEKLLKYNKSTELPKSWFWKRKNEKRRKSVKMLIKTTHQKLKKTKTIKLWYASSSLAHLVQEYETY